MDHFHGRDHFHEESVSRVKMGLNSIIYALCYIAMVFFALLAVWGFNSIFYQIAAGQINFMTIIVMLVSGGLAYGFYVLKNNQRIEYDYTFTNGVLDIAKIINNSKRKRLLSMNVKDFEVVAPISDEGFQRMLNHKGIQKRYNYFLNRGGGFTMVFLPRTVRNPCWYLNQVRKCWSCLKYIIPGI